MPSRAYGAPGVFLFPGSIRTALGLWGGVRGDGGSSVRDDVLQLLIAKTGLTPQHALTADEIPTLREAR